MGGRARGVERRSSPSSAEAKVTVCGNGDGARTRVRASEMGGCGDNGEGDGRGRVRCDEPMFFFSIMSLEGAGELSAGGLREISISAEVYF